MTGEVERAAAEALHAAIDGDFLVGAGRGVGNDGQDVAISDARPAEVVWWAVEALAAANLLGSGAAEEGLRARMEEAMRRESWWHTGGTPCVPQRAIRAALAEHAPQAGEEDIHEQCRDLIQEAYMKGRLAGPPDPSRPAMQDDLNGRITGLLTELLEEQRAQGFQGEMVERPGIVQNPGGMIGGVDHNFAPGGPEDRPLGGRGGGA